MQACALLTRENASAIVVRLRRHVFHGAMEALAPPGREFSKAGCFFWMPILFKPITYLLKRRFL